jgi:adenylate cyclase
LSDYFSVITEAIGNNNGTIDKFIGDVVMALWNAPKEDPDHVANGCKAALACQAACQRLNETASRNGYSGMFPVTTRFGLHTGHVMVGNVGSDDRMQYTALGATVNLASRIEAINKQYGTTLLITEAVADQVSGRFLLRSVDVIAPAGTSLPIAIYELFGELEAGSKYPATASQEQFCDAWLDCFQLYESRDWSEAVKAFERFLLANPDDKLAAIYVQRCLAFIVNPPPTDWDGVQVYDSK